MVSSPSVYSVYVFSFSKVTLGRAEKSGGNKTEPSFASFEQPWWEWLGKMLTGNKETPSLCWRVRSGLVQAGGQRWGSSTTALVVAERTRHQSSPSQETIRVPFLYLCLVIALLRNIYSSQLPEVKVWTSELERLGDGSEHSLRLWRRHLSCVNCFHHLSTSVLSVLPSTWTSHAKKFSSLFVCLFLASHRQNVSSGG